MGKLRGKKTRTQSKGASTAERRKVVVGGHVPQNLKEVENSLITKMARLRAELRPSLTDVLPFDASSAAATHPSYDAGTAFSEPVPAPVKAPADKRSSPTPGGSSTSFPPVYHPVQHHTDNPVIPLSSTTTTSTSNNNNNQHYHHNNSSSSPNSSSYYKSFVSSNAQNHMTPMYNPPAPLMHSSTVQISSSGDGALAALPHHHSPPHPTTTTTTGGSNPLLGGHPNYPNNNSSVSSGREDQAREEGGGGKGWNVTEIPGCIIQELRQKCANSHIDEESEKEIAKHMRLLRSFVTQVNGSGAGSNSPTPVPSANGGATQTTSNFTSYPVTLASPSFSPAFSPEQEYQFRQFQASSPTTTTTANTCSPQSLPSSSSLAPVSIQSTYSSPSQHAVNNYHATESNNNNNNSNNKNGHNNYGNHKNYREYNRSSSPHYNTNRNQIQLSTSPENHLNNAGRPHQQPHRTPRTNNGAGGFHSLPRAYSNNNARQTNSLHTNGEILEKEPHNTGNNSSRNEVGEESFAAILEATVHEEDNNYPNFVFDTSSFLESDNSVLELALQKNINICIPYTTLHELDRLSKGVSSHELMRENRQMTTMSDRVDLKHISIKIRNWILQKQKQFGNSRVRVQKKTEFLREYYANCKTNDDHILGFAVYLQETRKEVVCFVSEDKVLCSKAIAELDYKRVMDYSKFKRMAFNTK